MADLALFVSAKDWTDFHSDIFLLGFQFSPNLAVIDERLAALAGVAFAVVIAAAVLPAVVVLVVVLVVVVLVAVVLVVLVVAGVAN